MTTRITQLALLGAAIVTAIVAAVLVAVVAYPSSAQQSTAALEPTRCPRNWADLPTPERDQCGFQKATRIIEEATQEVMTALSRPTLPPLPPSGNTPIPYGYVPEKAKRIYQRDRNGAGVAQPVLRGANSVWHIGALPGSDGYEYSNIDLYAKPPTAEHHALLGITTAGNFVRAEDAVYSQHWEAPVNIGTITITNVLGPVTSPTGPVGIVNFTTSIGQAGTFDMGTHVWTIDGVVWVVPTPTVTPPVAVPYPGPVLTPTVPPLLQP